MRLLNFFLFGVILAGFASGYFLVANEQSEDNTEVKKEAVLPATHPFAQCATCHGVKGEGNEKLFAPKLNGQHIGYLKKQVEAFQNGWRGKDPKDVHGFLMATAIKDLSQEKIDAALDYLENVKSIEPGKRIFGDRWRGESLYERGCAICHGDKGEGSIQYNMARLDMQHGWYLSKQISHFRQNVRGTHSADESGKTMAFYAKLLPDDQAVEDVVSWLTYASRKAYREKQASLDQ
jgi:cytochrome c553